MAKQIEGVSERILNCAKEEFLDKGYTDASLRVIAAAAETSTNSIYVRFKDKEGLFSAIVEPVLNEMIERFLKIQETFYHMDQASQRAHMAEYADGGTMELVQYMYDHLDEFRLLLDASYGTRFHNFVDELVRIEVDYEGAVQATNEMSSSMIEYINGIEVIKAFNQGKTSYARLAEKVRANAQYYFDWMRRSQLGMSMAYAFFPAQMLTVLPFGWLFYTHGTLSIGTFLTVIILSLGMSGPIVAAFNFVDTLAQVGTTVHEVDEILNAEEQTHAETPVHLENHAIEVRNVHFGYHDDQEILHGVSLSIPQNSMTALVGPSGSGKSTLAKLIAGFWDVKSGTITMGGHALKEIPLTELYAQVAFVSQDNYLFDDTVRENIRMGRRDATDAEVEAAAQAAG